MILAHQGWDELLVAGAAALVTLGVLRWSERRARRRAEREEAQEEAHPAEGSGGGS